MLYIHNDDTLNREQINKQDELWDLLPDNNRQKITHSVCMDLRSVEENTIFLFFKFDSEAFNHLKELKAKLESILYHILIKYKKILC